MRAPGFCGNATTMPGPRPGPCSASMPWTDTWWGLALHLAVGVQLTLVMRTLSTCAELYAGLVAGARGVDAGADPPGLPSPAWVPPGLAARAGSARAPSVPASASAVSAAAANVNLDRLWAAVLASIQTPFAANAVCARAGRR